MRNALITFFVIIISCFALKNPVQAQISLQINPPSEVKVCENNTYSIRSFVIPASLLPFQFSITPTINQIPLPFPNCVNSSTPSNPIQVSNVNISSSNTCIGLVGTVLYNTTTNTYTYQANGISCSGMIEITITFDVNIDCAIIPQSINPSVPLDLQVAFNLTAYGLTFTTTDVSSLFYPYIIIPQPTLSFPGNYGQTTDMIFEYKNAGFSDAHIWFEWKDLYGNSCSSLYNTVSTVYYTGNCLVLK